MVTLRIQEQAEAKGITLTELGQLCGLSAEAMQKYATESIEITEETAADLRKVSAKLNVPVLELLKPVAKRGAFKLNILEKVIEKGLTIDELSQRSGVHISVLAFYSTQPICKQKLAKEPHHSNLKKISEILDCQLEELKVSAEMSPVILRLEEVATESGLTLKDLSLLNNIPPDLIDLITEHPLDPSLLMQNFKETRLHEPETSTLFRRNLFSRNLLNNNRIIRTESNTQLEVLYQELVSVLKPIVCCVFLKCRC